MFVRACSQVCGFGSKGWLEFQAVETQVRGPDTTGDLSLYPEAYQKQADIITAKILHQLCLPQVTGAQSGGNQRKREGEREGREKTKVWI